jgi:CRISPR/Cas system-associated protein endoribonuclease Cas2
MPQNDYGNPTSPFSGTQLNNRLRDWRDALHSLHRGTSRPSYAVPGMLWLLEISATEWRLQLYDGDTDILLGTINPTANTFTPAGVTGFAPLTGATFTGPVVVPNATADGHALNRVTADGRYALLTGATFTGAVTLEAPLTLPSSNPTNADHAARKAYVDAGDRWVTLVDAAIANSAVIDVTGFSLADYYLVEAHLLNVLPTANSSSSVIVQVYRNQSLVSTGYFQLRLSVWPTAVNSGSHSNTSDFLITASGIQTERMVSKIIISQTQSNQMALLQASTFFQENVNGLMYFMHTYGRATGGSGWVNGLRITSPVNLTANVGRLVVMGLKKS